jgi:trimeric autotransporter adhesin
MKFFPALQIGYAWLYNLKAGLVTQASTAAYESAPLGAELLSADGWTSTDWTGDWASGWDHTTGNTTALLNSLAAVSGNYYQIAYTVTGRTAGTFTITFGGVTSEAISATGAWGPKATSTGSLSITPTSTFDGTIVISIKQITGTYAPVYRILNSAAGSALEIRSTTNALCNTFIGIGVGRYNTTGGYNTALGYLALYYNTTGNYNTALGAKAFYSNTTGNYNTALGALALFSNTTGSYNTALGYQALFSNTTGSYNTAFGYLAFYSNTTGNYNTALGALALFSNTTGGYNTAFGYLALYSNTTGGYNTALGYQALYSNTTGGYNTAFGYLAGRYISSGAANQTSGNSVYLGYDTRSSADGNTNETVLGNTAVGNGSNTVTLGNTSVTGWYMGATKLIGAQGAAVDDATGAGDVVAQLNALLARIRAHGLIAT